MKKIAARVPLNKLNYIKKRLGVTTNQDFVQALMRFYLNRITNEELDVIIRKQKLEQLNKG